VHAHDAVLGVVGEAVSHAVVDNVASGIVDNAAADDAVVGIEDVLRCRPALGGILAPAVAIAVVVVGEGLRPAVLVGAREPVEIVVAVAPVAVHAVVGSGNAAVGHEGQGYAVGRGCYLMAIATTSQRAAGGRCRE